MHVGLIGGIGPAATDFYYRGLVDRHRTAGIPLECTIAHADVGTMGRNLADGRRAEQAAIFAGLIERMKKAGAEVAAVTSMGGHFCIGELLPISPLPLVHGIQAVDAGIRRSGLSRIGVLGTRLVMETGLYGGVSSAELIAPAGERFGQVGDAYSAMAGIGKVTDEQRRIFFTAGRELMARGAEAVMLGGTDLFLAFVGQPPPFPLVDCADLHVDAIFAKSSAP
ncbi:MAG: aspartate/glutamate racemase family protein [Proteobacteria bacterium]|nr:aspartate/glutamate racemase family protein [Pseudomonadota bacterium]